MIIHKLRKTSVIWLGDGAPFQGMVSHETIGWGATKEEANCWWGAIVGQEQQRKRQTYENIHIKTNAVTFHFSNMASKILQDCGRIKKTFSNIP